MQEARCEGERRPRWPTGAMQGPRSTNPERRGRLLSRRAKPCASDIHQRHLGLRRGCAGRPASQQATSRSPRLAVTLSTAKSDPRFPQTNQSKVRRAASAFERPPWRRCSERRRSAALAEPPLQQQERLRQRHLSADAAKSLSTDGKGSHAFHASEADARRRRAVPLTFRRQRGAPPLPLPSSCRPATCGTTRCTSATARRARRTRRA